MKINGTVIGQIYAHNEGYTKEYPSDECEYCYNTYLLNKGYNPTLTKGTLLHNREDGFLVLAEKLFRESQKDANL